MIDNSPAAADIVQKIAHALNLKVFSFCGSHLALNSLREDADQASNVELSSPGHLRMITFLSYEDLLYHILHSKNIHICRAHSIDNPLRDGWIKLVNPFYHLTPEAAAIKADFSMTCQQMAKKEAGKMEPFEDMLFGCVFKDVSMNPASTLECNTHNCLLEISFSMHLHHREQSARNMLLRVLPQCPCAIY